MRGPTAFLELNGVLDELVTHAQAIFDNDLFGAYLVGSFAVGDADIHSDCDFLIAVRRPITAGQEAALRALHHALPARDGHWNRHLEGSYPLVDDLRSLEALGREWLHIDHGHETMEWSTRCNNAVHRWSLRERGVALLGPEPSSFACDVPPEVLRARMRAYVLTFIADLLTRTDFRVAWAQRYAVTTLCRILHTIESGVVWSKRESLIWGGDNLDPRWSDLIRRAHDERPRGYDGTEPPKPGSVDETLSFAEYAKHLAYTLPS